MTVQQIYDGSNGVATKALYDRLTTLGPLGIVALNLFRACKCSERAKLYRKGEWKREAYGRKDWSIGLLCEALEAHGDGLGIPWGWKIDPAQEYHCWVLYVDLPPGQVSFHAEARKSARDYPGEWDRSGASATRIIRWVTEVHLAIDRKAQSYDKEDALASAFAPQSLSPSAVGSTTGDAGL